MWIYRIAFRHHSHMQASTWLVLNVSTPSFPLFRPTRLVRVASFHFWYLRTILALRARASLHIDKPTGEKAARSDNDAVSLLLPPFIPV